MLYCKKCGNKLEDGANFCPKCGCPTDSTLANDSDTIVDNGKFAPNVQVQPTNQFEASTGEKSKLGCWSKILYTFLFFILIGFLAEECGGGDTNMDESNAPQATENVKSGGGGDTNMDESNAPQATENVKSSDDCEQPDDIAKKGYEDGYEMGFKEMEGHEKHEGIDGEDMVRIWYGSAPKNEKEKRLYKKYRDNFWKGYKDGLNNR